MLVDDMKVVPDWWDWRVSAFARLGSTGAAWLFVVLATAPPLLLLALGLTRTAGSMGQLLLNRKLAQRQPLEGRDWLDWLLLGGAFAISIGAAALARGGVDIPHQALLAAVLVPFTGLHVRAAARSLRAHRTTAIPSAAVIPFPARTLRKAA